MKWVSCSKKQPPDPYKSWTDENGQGWFSTDKRYLCTFEKEDGTRVIDIAQWTGKYWWFNNSMNEVHPIAWGDALEPFEGN